MTSLEENNCGGRAGIARPLDFWRKGEAMVQHIDGVAFQMGEPFDFGFLSKYGRVFKVFDDQDSGNICFGTEMDGQRYFVKFAGAPTARCPGEPKEAVKRLKASLPVYRDLSHPNLIRLIEAEDMGGGFGMVFRWAEGDCMGRMYPEEHRRFMALPIGDRLEVFDRVLDFLGHVHSMGYLAVDFYDGSIMYDFASGKTTFCDVDFFVKKPYINTMGRMWGSSRFMSPEEFRLGAEIDEATNVYTAGAMAFALLGNYSREREDWPLGEGLFKLARRAVSDSRAERPGTIRELRELWQEQLELNS